LLNLHGIAKPVYQAFQLLHRVGYELLPVSGTHDTVSAWVTCRGKSVTVLLTNYAMPHHSITAERVRVRLRDALKPRTACVERIDADHANPHALWSAMGEPEYLNASDVEQLQAASSVLREPFPATFDHLTVQFDITLPPHSVAAITIDGAVASDGERPE
jgi:xylan 1,4-beta-xylosidase